MPALKCRIEYLCDPQWFRDTASRGPTTIVTPKSQFRTCPTDHDKIGYPRMKASGESLTTKHRLLHASGPHPIPPPNRPQVSRQNGSKVRRLISTHESERGILDNEASTPTCIGTSPNPTA
ncbi:hypothetical protein F511_16011 [Dorcoceras hygrometricum]|uniref:Uncharacterized protein n=1 Tax=Dorcoceras hygrometricum TaxID=472368 RepID=A0A2Z7BNU4_9LAMI|nr:hypothetical protein F511_16011 [Dorcoceras hygrometricum]